MLLDGKLSKTTKSIAYRRRIEKGWRPSDTGGQHERYSQRGSLAGGLQVPGAVQPRNVGPVHGAPAPHPGVIHQMGTGEVAPGARVDGAVAPGGTRPRETALWNVLHRHVQVQCSHHHCPQGRLYFWTITVPGNVAFWSRPPPHATIYHR